jgi:hypothetical protein
MAAMPSSLMAQSQAERIWRDHTPDEINSAMCATSDYVWCMGDSVKDLSLRSMETPQQVVEAAERSNCLREKSAIITLTKVAQHV